MKKWLSEYRMALIVLVGHPHEIQPVHSEGDQSWMFFGRNNAKAETPVLWPPHAKSWLTGKDSDAGRDWGQEEKGMTEDEMAGRHHWLDGRESEWTPGVGDEQRDLACCDSWGPKESDTTERLNWTEHEYVSDWELGSMPLSSITGVWLSTYHRPEKIKNSKFGAWFLLNIWLLWHHHIAEKW